VLAMRPSCKQQRKRRISTVIELSVHVEMTQLEFVMTRSAGRLLRNS